MLHCMDKVNELLDKLELTSFSQFSSAVVQAYDQYHRRITGHGQGASLQLTSRLGNTKSATPHVISTARLFILWFTARRRGGNTRGVSSHSLQTLSTSDSSHSLSGDRYGRTSGSLNPQQSAVLSRQPQTSSSVPYIAHGSYSPYNMNGDATDINRWYFLEGYACNLQSCIVIFLPSICLLFLQYQMPANIFWLLVTNKPMALSQGPLSKERTKMPCVMLKGLRPCTVFSLCRNCVTESFLLVNSSVSCKHL